MSERNGIINSIVGLNEMYDIISNNVGLNEMYNIINNIIYDSICIYNMVIIYMYIYTERARERVKERKKEGEREFIRTLFSPPKNELGAANIVKIYI